jgi:multisubunit Na+/H+ antiporter MnhF subunit
VAGVNVWLVAGLALMLGLVPCTIVATRGTLVDRLIGLELAAVLTVLALLTIEQGLQRQSFYDLSLALAVLTFPSSLLFARIFRRWL